MKPNAAISRYCLIVVNMNGIYKVLLYMASSSNVGNDLRIYFTPIMTSCSGERHFLNLRYKNEQSSTIRQNKLNSLIVKSI